jgi:hypothetical protein
MRRSFLFLSMFVLALGTLSMAAHAAVADDDDEALSLSPVKKGQGKEEPTAEPTLAPTAAPTAMATPMPTAVPTPKPKAPKPVAAVLSDVQITRTSEGVRIVLKAAGPINGAAANLAKPERVLIKLAGATLAGTKEAKERLINLGAAKRLRLATKNATELWAVVDLDSKVAFKTGQPSSNSFEVVLLTGGSQPAPTVVPTPRSSAEVPKVNLMLFDLNVIYQDKQYDRFPCANFIYNSSDNFPLKREFVSTFVFHNGYGAFVGNVRIMDPKGQLVAQTETPFAFNLFNKLTDFMVELPWKAEFKEKGTYTLYLALNGADVLKHPFYVGHNTDTPPAE